VFKAQADIAERVASALSVTIGANDRAALRRPDSRDPDAREAVMLGFSLLQKRGASNLKQAIVQFDRAIAHDSMYARAWAGKAEAHGLLPSYFDTTANVEAAFATAERAARRALALDSLLPDAHAALATVIHERPNEALREVDRAIALDPGSAMAQSRRGTLLLLLGRVADAEAPLRRTIALDPLVAAHTARLGWWYLAAGRIDSLPNIMHRVIELDPLNTVIPYLGAVMYAHAGRLDDAIKACAAYSGHTETCKDIWSALVDPRQGGHTLALLNGRGRNGGELILTMPSFRALGYARLGATDSAFAALREVTTEHDANLMAWINSPWFTPLKTDLRWDAIVGEMRRQ
jgi:tetratricopeptide (TPR) repeat protein